MNPQIVRGPLLNPRHDGTVTFLPDAALRTDARGRLTFVGPWDELPDALKTREIPQDCPDGLLLPPLLDCHTHISQHRIRGRFTEGVEDDPPEGPLLAGLLRNVFPEEIRSSDTEYAAQVVREFAQDTLAQGVIGGAAYMTVHAGAARAALAALPESWSIGLVLMNQNCPASLRTDEDRVGQDIRSLAANFGRRLIITDRFAVSVDTPLRRRGVRLAGDLGLRMQTHLNEQRAEKALVENTLYSDYAHYTDVYRRDGLLDHDAILAHCIQMTPDEWDIIAGATIAHCPTSNTLLGSGVMPLDEVRERRLPYAICTDVGASPTTSLLAEMAQFLTVHAGRSRYATPQEALFRVTLAPAQILGLADRLGSFAVGKPLSFIEVDCDQSCLRDKTADRVITEDLLAMPAIPASNPALDCLAAEGLPHGEELARLTADVHDKVNRLEGKVRRVVLDGRTVWLRV